jgi:periplasmic protein TonB
MPDTETLPPPVSSPTASERTEPPFRPAPEDVYLSGELKEEGVFASLISSFRDVFFPAKLPPLVLESKPIAVPDRMATKMSPSSIAGSVAFYALLLLLIGILIRNHVQLSAPTKLNLTTLIAPLPPSIPPKAEQIGGGGGQHDIAPVSQGHLPKFAQEQIVPPKAPPTIPPKLAIDPTIVMQKDLKMADSTLPNLGAPNSPNKGLSLGSGSGTGIGAGDGSGFGPGTGGNTGGGAFHVGGGVSKPDVLYAPEAEFSEEARKAKFSGNVEVYLFVDADGKPSHIRVVRGVGMGLDEKAIEAVRQYKFKPAMKDGKPVQVDLYIDVNFQIL